MKLKNERRFGKLGSKEVWKLGRKEYVCLK